MKKIVFSLLMLAVMLVGGKAMAQDCDAIVGPLLQRRGINPDNYSAGKIKFLCIQGRNFFYFADEVSADARVFNLSEVVEIATGTTLPSNFVPDLNTFSYYAYNFEQLQIQFNFQTLYFRLPAGSEHPYLALRSFHDCNAITGEEVAVLSAQGYFDED